MYKCIACGACAEKCPAKTSDEFNEGIVKRKAAYVSYAQAVPLKYAIDPDRCIFLKKGKCGACKKICPTDAINFDDKEEQLTLNVGSIIVTAGFKTFDPLAFDNYQHAKLPNVVTSMEFERILSAGGPTAGHVLRPSDQKEPAKIAWLQCVGSRDLNKCDNEYCSSVCCMYAIKEAVIAREHLGADFQGSIFYMDMRTHGKDFEKYYDRAKADGIRFIRSRVHTVNQTDESGTLTWNTSPMRVRESLKISIWWCSPSVWNHRIQPWKWLKDWALNSINIILSKPMTSIRWPLQGLAFMLPALSKGARIFHNR